MIERKEDRDFCKVEHSSPFNACDDSIEPSHLLGEIGLEKLANLLRPLHILHRYLERRNKNVTVMPTPSYSNNPLNDTIIPSNDSSKNDYTVHISPVPPTFDISNSNIPSDSIVSIPTVLHTLTSDQGKRYHF